jgi:hypothetical protein
MSIKEDESRWLEKHREAFRETPAKKIPEVLQRNQDYLIFMQFLFQEILSFEVVLQEQELKQLADDPYLWAEPDPEELAFFDAEFDERVISRVRALLQPQPPSVEAVQRQN